MDANTKKYEIYNSRNYISRLDEDWLKTQDISTIVEII